MLSLTDPLGSGIGGGLIMGFSEIAKMNPHREMEETMEGEGVQGEWESERGCWMGGGLHPHGPPADDQHRHHDGHPPPLMSPVTAEHAAVRGSTNRASATAKNKHHNKPSGMGPLPRRLPG